MLTYISETVAEENQASFNAALVSLKSRIGGGIEYYSVRGSTIVEYNPVDNTLYHHIELNGYRNHSFGAIKPLTSTEEEEVYREVGLGLVDIAIIDCHSGRFERFWRGKMNLGKRRIGNA